jgi:hypothetical protein
VVSDEGWQISFMRYRELHLRCAKYACCRFRSERKRAGDGARHPLGQFVGDGPALDIPAGVVHLLFDRRSA